MPEQLRPRSRPRLLVPEVLQSSAMDCGPAALQALLAGFGIEVSYGRLRELGQTDVDGTSLDTLEELANLLGLEAEQVMVPSDHLFRPDRHLPAILVLRRPDGAPHFVVVWSRIGPYLQVMDPARGRRFTTSERLRRDLFVHSHRVDAAAWREWAASDEFLDLLDHRLRDLGGGEAGRRSLIRHALDSLSWTGLATLDARARMVTELVESGAVRRGREAWSLLEELESDDVPADFWCVKPVKTDPESLLLRGAVLVRVRGLRSRPPAEAEPGSGTTGVGLDAETLPRIIRQDPRPGRELVELLREDGLLAPAFLAGGLLVSATAVLVEALLLRGLLDVGQLVAAPGLRLGAMAALLLFLGGLAVTDLSIAHGLARLGRRLELRLRMELLAKLPRLEDRYLRTRLSSDMAQRAHLLHRVRGVAGLGGRLLRDLFELALVVAAIAWLDPGAGLLALIAALLVVLLPLAAQRRLAERDLRAQSQSATLSRFYLDALLGLLTIRTCGGERSFLRQHEMQTSLWARAAFDLQRGLLSVQAIQLVVGFGFAAWILTSHLGRQGIGGGTLLLVYWTLRLPVLGEDIVRIAGLYPRQRNILLRLLEPLGAAEEARAAEEGEEEEGLLQPGSRSGEEPARRGAAARLRFENATVVGGGTPILRDVTLDLPAGSHTAVVGPSGAGKSTLVACLLGFHRPSSGRVLVDGEELRGQCLRRLRRETAWVDPEVQLWNRSFYDNVTYGLDGEPRDLPTVLQAAEAYPILERLPQGMASRLGESGGLLSGGEGQRVRLARALLRPDVRLVLLDEAFRGLDGEARRRLLERCRDHWRGATLLCVTHDLEQTTTFDRVVVLEEGRVVEAGRPRELLAVASRYRALLEGEELLQRELWEAAEWRRLHLEEGRLRESA